MQADSFYHYNDYPAQQINHAIHEAQYESITFQPFMIVAGDVGTIEIDEQLITDILHKASDTYSETTDHYPPAVTTTTAQLMMVDNDTGNLRPADNPADAQYLIATMSSVIDVENPNIATRSISAGATRNENRYRDLPEYTCCNPVQHRPVTEAQPSGACPETSRAAAGTH